MRNLSSKELIEINGGTTTPPTVSGDPSVQAGYSVGYRIGRAIGQTIEDIGTVLDTLNPFNWFS